MQIRRAYSRERFSYFNLAQTFILDHKPVTVYEIWENLHRIAIRNESAM